MILAALPSRQARLANELDAAMFAVGLALAEETTADASDEDVVRALRQSVCMAAAFSDLCRELGVPLPYAVQRALCDDGGSD